MFSKVMSIIFICCLVVASVRGLEKFEEEVFINHFPSKHVYSLFQFTTQWSVNVFEDGFSNHFNYFPRSLGEIISNFGIAELHLSLTQGRWRYNVWGHPVISAPTGIELWVWFRPDLNATSVDERWPLLLHALSGQFCSSVNFITTGETAQPKLSFKPQGVWLQQELSASKHLRYGLLPRETVCTENLTPWKKLLPCGGATGLSSLLNALALYDSSYHSLAVHFRSVCQDDECSDPMVELSQTISSVFDLHHKMLFKAWSLKDLFDETITTVCPLASSSHVIINQQNLFRDSFSPQPDEEKKIVIGGQDFRVYVYDVKKANLPFNVHVKFDASSSEKNDMSTYIFSHKHATGYGEEYGGSRCTIRNLHPDKNITISYLDVMPYFVRTYLHTLKVQVDGMDVQPDDLSFLPAYRRERPACLEFRLTIPARSEAVVFLEFEKVFLDWTEHPPDAHHGFYIGPSVISGVVPLKQLTVIAEDHSTVFKSVTNNSEGKGFVRIYTEPLLFRVPLPDFSMPYNVICLSCTVIAIAFGSLFNLTTRSFTIERQAEKKTLMERIRNFFAHFKKKNKDAEDEGKGDANDNDDNGDDSTGESVAVDGNDDLTVE